MLAVLIHPLFLKTFITWFFFEKPIHVVKTGLAYMRAVSGIFSFVFLLKTIFYPWKNMARSYPEKGFDINLIISIFGENLIARGVGGIVRITTIITGIIIELLILLTMFSYLVIWYFFPIILFFIASFISRRYGLVL